jgi:hypothetical protein
MPHIILHLFPERQVSITSSVLNQPFLSIFHTTIFKPVMTNTQTLNAMAVW